MKKYETVIRIVGWGESESDAEQRACALIDLSKMESEMVVSTKGARLEAYSDEPLFSSIRS